MPPIVQRHVFRVLLSAIAAAAVSGANQHAASREPTASSRDVDYEGPIRPILESHCFRCHGPDQQKSGLRLDLRERALAGGDAGPAIVPSNSRASELIRRV